MNNFIASYAIFRELYNSDQNIHSILGKYIKDIIFDKHLEVFTVPEIHEYLKEQYGFELPNATIFYSIRKLNIAKIIKGTFYLSDKEWFSDFKIIRDEYNEII